FRRPGGNRRGDGHGAHERAIPACLAGVCAASGADQHSAGSAGRVAGTGHAHRYNRRVRARTPASAESMKEILKPPVTIASGERLVSTLFFAVLLHGIVILGIGFKGEQQAVGRTSTLETTLAHTPNQHLPDGPDCLANASQRGEGNTLEHVRPEAAMSTPEQNILEGIEAAPDEENRRAETVRGEREHAET